MLDNVQRTLCILLSYGISQIVLLFLGLSQKIYL